MAAIPADEPIYSSFRLYHSLTHKLAGAAERDSLPTSIPPHSSAPNAPYLGSHFQPGAEQEAVQVSIFHERQDHHGLGHLQGAQLDAHPWETWTTHIVPWEKGSRSTQIPAGGWEETAHTEELDDIGMVKVLHARCFAEELFDFPLGKVIHWEVERKSFKTPEQCQDAITERSAGNVGIQWDKHQVLWGRETTYISWSSQPLSVGALRAG